MVALQDGWWINTQSDSSQKYLQLLAAKKKLNLDYEISIAEEFEEYSKAEKGKPRAQDSICVVFGDHDYIIESHNEDVFIKAVERIGPEWIMQRCIEYQGRTVVTRYNKYQRQRKLACGLWITFPPTTKDMRQIINLISDKLKLGIEALTLPELAQKRREEFQSGSLFDDEETYG